MGGVDAGDGGLSADRAAPAAVAELAQAENVRALHDELSRAMSDLPLA